MKIEEKIIVFINWKFRIHAIWHPCYKKHSQKIFKHSKPAYKNPSPEEQSTEKNNVQSVLFCFFIESWSNESPKDTLIHLYEKHTGRPGEQIRKDTERNFFMSAEEAKAYGIIDNVIAERKKV